MKRSLLLLSSFVLLSAMAFATTSPSWEDIFDKHKKKRREAMPESGVVPMLVLSLGAIAGGLTLKQRRSAKTAA
jgi:hypothetical protein